MWDLHSHFLWVHVAVTFGLKMFLQLQLFQQTGCVGRAVTFTITFRGDCYF